MASFGKWQCVQEIENAMPATFKMQHLPVKNRVKTSTGKARRRCTISSTMDSQRKVACVKESATASMILCMLRMGTSKGHKSGAARNPSSMAG